MLCYFFHFCTQDRKEAGDHIAKKVGFIAIIGRASGCGFRLRGKRERKERRKEGPKGLSATALDGHGGDPVESQVNRRHYSI